MAKRRILVVDDEVDIRRLVSEALEVSGYEVRTAASGEEAIRAAALQLPDLVLLDVMMPGMDGFTVYERLRAKPVDLRSPIVFLTARREIDDKQADQKPPQATDKISLNDVNNPHDDQHQAETGTDPGRDVR